MTPPPKGESVADLPVCRNRIAGCDEDRHHFHYKVSDGERLMYLANGRGSNDG